jgi:hypothetical protein
VVLTASGLGSISILGETAAERRAGMALLARLQPKLDQLDVDRHNLAESTTAGALAEAAARGERWMSASGPAPTVLTSSAARAARQDLEVALDTSGWPWSLRLSRWLEARLRAMERQSRHRYVRLAAPSVGHAVEALMAVSPTRPRVTASVGPPPARFRGIRRGRVRLFARP